MPLLTGQVYDADDDEDTDDEDDDGDDKDGNSVDDDCDYAGCDDDDGCDGDDAGDGGKEEARIIRYVPVRDAWFIPV